MIPAYNVAEHLPRCLRSVLGQSRPPEEVLVVDDGSTDGTAAAASRFGPPVRVIRQQNAGASAARNRGILEARGQFVAFLDSDDEWLESHLANAARTFEAHPELQWYCDPTEAIRPNGIRVLFQASPDPGEAEEGVLSDFLVAQARHWLISTDSVVVRRSAFAEVGLFETSLPVGEDRDLWFRLGLRFPRIGYCPEIGARYTSRQGSLTASGLLSAELSMTRMARLTEAVRRAGGDAESRARPLLCNWTVSTLKQVLRGGDRGEIRWILKGLSPFVPPAWKAIAHVYLWMPWLVRLYWLVADAWRRRASS